MSTPLVFKCAALEGARYLTGGGYLPDFTVMETRGSTVDPRTARSKKKGPCGRWIDVDLAITETRVKDILYVRCITVESWNKV